MAHSMAICSKKTLLTLVIIFHGALLFATDQMPEVIVCSGSTLYISGLFEEDFPLHPILEDETYTSKMGEQYARIQHLSSCNTSTCYRGYQGIWEIYNGVLYLKEVLDCCTGEPVLDLKKVFGEKNVGKKGVRAFWINGPFYLSSMPINSSTINEDIKTIGLIMDKGQIQGKE